MERQKVTRNTHRSIARRQTPEGEERQELVRDAQADRTGTMGQEEHRNSEPSPTTGEEAKPHSPQVGSA